MKCSDRISSYTNTTHGFVAATVLPFAVTAPDGTFSATSITETATTDKHCIQNGFTQGAAGYYTVSLYVKPNGRTKITIREEYSYGGDIDFDLTTQTASAGAGAWISNSGRVQAFNNGWYRISAVINLTSANAYCVFDVIANSGSATSYAGDPTKGFYAWGFQIELGAFLTSYISTSPAFTSRSSSATYFDKDGVLRTAPVGGARYGYELPYKQVDFGLDSGSNVVVNNTTPAGTSGQLRSQGLILEPAATNLATYSYNLSTLNTGYYLTTSSASNFAVTTETTAPDNTNTASKFIFTGTNDRLDATYGTVPAAGWYTFSVWLKGVAGTVVQIALLMSTGGNIEPGVYLTGQWQRFSARRYFNSGEALRIHAPIIRGAMGNSVTANTGETGVYASYVYVWGLQIEAGTSPTSYIPTYGATATRAADVAATATVTRARDSAALIGSNFTSWWKNTEQTYYAEADQFPASDYGRLIDVSDGANQKYSMYRQSGTGTNGINSQIQITGDTWSTNTFARFAASFSSTGISSGFNGTLRTNVSSFTPFTADRMNIGQQSDSYGVWNGHIKKISYYNKRLTDTQLQALTV
jgi:hypothetical protein